MMILVGVLAVLVVALSALAWSVRGRSRSGGPGRNPGDLQQDRAHFLADVQKRGRDLDNFGGGGF